MLVSDTCANNETLKLNLITKIISFSKILWEEKNVKEMYCLSKILCSWARLIMSMALIMKKDQWILLAFKMVHQRKTLSDNASLRVFQVCDYDPSILIESIGQNIVRKWRMFEVKEQYMQMILHLNEDFDDDLLLDVLNLLDCIWSLSIFKSKNKIELNPLLLD